MPKRRGSGRNAKKPMSASSRQQVGRPLGGPSESESYILLLPPRKEFVSAGLRPLSSEEWRVWRTAWFGETMDRLSAGPPQRRSHCMVGWETVYARRAGAVRGRSDVVLGACHNGRPGPQSTLSQGELVGRRDQSDGPRCGRQWRGELQRDGLGRADFARR